MSDRAMELNKHCVEFCKLISHYDTCLEFESTIGVKCDDSPIVTNIEKEISYINTVLEV